MAVAFRSVAHGSSYGSGAAEPAGAADGDLLVAVVGYFYDRTALTPTLSGSGWTRQVVVAGPATVNDTVLAIFTKTRSGATGTTTVTPGGSGGDYLISVSAYTGADTTSPIDGTPTTYAGNNNPTLPAATVAAAGSMLIAVQCCYNQASNAWTASGYTFTYRNGPSYELRHSTAPADAGTTPAVVGSGGNGVGNNSSNSGVALVTIKPAGGGGGPTRPPQRGLLLGVG